MRSAALPGEKPLEMLGSSRKDLREMPEQVRFVFGGALFAAQSGAWPIGAKAFKGYHGSSVVELTEDFDGDTYRAVYTVRFARAVYVLHVFQKKSKRGARTTRQDVELIAERMQQAEAHYREHYGG